MTKEAKLPKGVEKLPSGKFRARLMVGGKATRLGPFDTAEEAAAAYRAAGKPPVAAEDPDEFAEVLDLGEDSKSPGIRWLARLPNGHDCGFGGTREEAVHAAREKRAWIEKGEWKAGLPPEPVAVPEHLMDDAYIDEWDRYIRALDELDAPQFVQAEAMERHYDKFYGPEGVVVRMERDDAANLAQARFEVRQSESWHLGPDAPECRLPAAHYLDDGVTRIRELRDIKARAVALTAARLRREQDAARAKGRAELAARAERP